MTDRATRFAAAALLLGALGLGGCAVSNYHLTDDYGRAVREGVAAHIANPDARYSGDPTPGSDGVRVLSAQTRYETGAVKEPAAVAVGNK